MYERYCYLRDRKGYKDSDISKITEITKSTFTDWKNGKSKPNADKLIKIAKCLDTTVEYLVTGEKPEIPDIEQEYFELMELYGKLKEGQKTAVMNLLRSFTI